jgi:HTH-type transcriptional regulator / antitoxin HigA
MVQGLHSAEKGEKQMSVAAEYRDLLASHTPKPIRSHKEYEQALVKLEALMVPHPSAVRSMLIEVLSTLIESYESRQCPEPEMSSSEVLARLLETKGVTAAEVAKSTGIPPATISNVLANRRGISKQNALKLSDYFGLSPVLFLGR